MEKMGRRGHGMMRRKGHKGHGKHRKGGKAHKKNKMHKKDKMGWLNLNSDCGLTCAEGEVCLKGPMEAKPMCVSKKDVKKSVKLFHKYQKKEKKAWKEYRKNHYNKSDKKPAKYFAKFGVTDVQKLKLTKEDKMLLKEGGNCPGMAIRAMRKRLMGWFHLLHGQDADARKAANLTSDNIKDFHKHVSTATMTKTLDGSECQCTKSTMWQFGQMDKDGSDGLSVAELAPLLDNSAEPCVRPAVEACDRDADGTVTQAEWCCCFSRMVAPCFNHLAKVQKSGAKDQYVPRCDREGYYLREQCSGDSGAFSCWCVDYNGNKQEGSQAQGRAHCTKKALMELKEKAKQVAN